MLRSVSLPVWLLVLIVGFAAVTFASHFLLPSVRWFFRRRLEKAVARLNARLDRPIELFRLAARQDMIVRLSYDPQVLAAVTDHAAEAGVPGSVVAYALAVAAPVDRAGLEAAVVETQAALVAAGAVLKLPPQGMAALIREGLEPLVRRGIVGADLVPMAGPLLEFYAAPLRQRLENQQLRRR